MIPEDTVSLVAQSVVTPPHKSILGYVILVLACAAFVNSYQVFLN